jgi:hypothetical protein
MADTALLLLRGRLNGRQRLCLVRLLDMLYKPGELAEEVGFSVRQVYRVYVPAGCPHERDAKGRLWINGRAFRQWCEEVYAKQELAADQAFCLTCKQGVPMVEPVQRQEGRLVYWLCQCPQCGRKLARIIERRRGGRDQS